MSIHFSPVIATQPQGNGGNFSVQSIDLKRLGSRASPMVVVDDFRVRGRPFPPHPHAGFSAVTYVFEDSKASLRSRASLGADKVVGPGGIVWTQAASGVIHEELPAEEGRELHGLQIFVNLSSKHKLAAPRVLGLEAAEVPEWKSGAGDRVRVVVGSFEGISSPLVSPEPFDLLDVQLRQAIAFTLREGHNAVVYVVKGDIAVKAGDRKEMVAADHALGLHGSGLVKFDALRPAHFLVLSGAEIREPVLVHGSFIMNNMKQVEAAAARYSEGAMGHLAPLR